MQAVITRRNVSGRALAVVLALSASLLLGGLGGYWVKGAAEAPQSGKTIVQTVVEDTSGGNVNPIPGWAPPGQ